MTTTPTTPRALLDSAISSSAESPAARLKRERAKAEREHLELTFLQWARGMYALGLLPMPHPQWQFEPGRDWAYDFCYLGVNGRTLAIDIDGALWGRRNPKTGEWEAGKRGGHTSGSGYENDREKDAHAIMAGVYPLRLTAKMLKDGTGFAYVERALGVHRPVTVDPDFYVRMPPTSSARVVVKARNGGRGKPRIVHDPFTDDGKAG